MKQKNIVITETVYREGVFYIYMFTIIQGEAAGCSYVSFQQLLNHNLTAFIKNIIK